MKKFVQFGFYALILLGIFPGIAAAQSTPTIDLFGGYSYLHLQVPSSGVTLPQNQSFALQGWDASFSIQLFHHFSAEADVSGHQNNNCGGISDLKCDDFSYMFGPRITFGDHSSKITAFAHGLVGRDQADILGLNDQTFSDTSIAIAGGGGLQYWFMRRVGVQLGPIDALYTNHLTDVGASSQLTYRASAGLAFRFGGDLPPGKPKPQTAPAQEKPKTHRSWIRPWHKTVVAPEETEPGAAPAAAPAPAQPAPAPAIVPSRGMPIHSLGVVVAPQEFEGARILSIESGSVAEMASLHVGDLIKSVDGKAVRTPMELAAELTDKSGKVRIGLMRGTFATETVVLLGAH